MKIDQTYFREILDELIEDNPLACQGILAVSRLEFTATVPTLAVTLNEDPPRLLVNLDFVRKNCCNETDVRALLLHEFLHVLLNHTGEFDVCDWAINIALDAVINHIIHRSCGVEHADFFRRYYANSPSEWAVLLAPPEAEFQLTQYPPGDGGWTILNLRFGLLRGTVLADDILELARAFNEAQPDRGTANGSANTVGTEVVFLGNHDPDRQAKRKLGEPAGRALQNTFKQLNGDGIFREPQKHGFACVAGAVGREWLAREEKLRRWERAAWKTIRPLLTPDPRSRSFDTVDRAVSLPILNGADRRGILRSLWNPLIPDIRWDLPSPRPAGSTLIYLDVSGSMEAEMQSLVTLLNRFRRWIRLPFWAFSDEVAPATIEYGELKTRTTGGTSVNCVLAHLAETRPEKALVVTDGYIEACDPTLLRKIRGVALHALVSRDGNPAALEQAGIPCTQLNEYPD